MLAPTMLKVAGIIGNMLAGARRDRRKLSAMQGASASMIVAGQRKGGAMRLFLIYPEGNFIEATEDTPFLQIGEHKYGKPILDRVVKPSPACRCREGGAAVDGFDAAVEPVGGDAAGSGGDRTRRLQGHAAAAGSRPATRSSAPCREGLVQRAARRVHLILTSPEGWLAALMMVVFNGIVFSGVQFGLRVMLMAEPDDGPKGGLRQHSPAVAPQVAPAPVAVVAGRPKAAPRRG
jgi:hypothetical protein